MLVRFFWLLGLSRHSSLVFFAIVWQVCLSVCYVFALPVVVCCYPNHRVILCWLRLRPSLPLVTVLPISLAAALAGRSYGRVLALIKPFRAVLAGLLRQWQ